jgi:hypothetical protein
LLGFWSVKAPSFVGHNTWLGRSKHPEMKRIPSAVGENTRPRSVKAPAHFVLSADAPRSVKAPTFSRISRYSGPMGWEYPVFLGFSVGQNTRFCRFTFSVELRSVRTPTFGSQRWLRASEFV